MCVVIGVVSEWAAPPPPNELCLSVVCYVVLPFTGSASTHQPNTDTLEAATARLH